MASALCACTKIMFTNPVSLGWMPNGFGMVSADGVVQGGNQNELTDVTDRDPFTGIPHHRYVRCRVERVAG